MLIIEYPKCSTCKKAKKWLETSGMLYKSMQLKDKLYYIPEDEQLRLPATDSMPATDGIPVKRPIAVTESLVLIGFKPNNREIPGFIPSWNFIRRAVSRTIFSWIN